MAKKKTNKSSGNRQKDYLMSPEELKAKLSSEEAAARKEKEAVIGAPVSEIEAQAMSRASANKILGITEQERLSFEAMQALVSSGTVAKAMFGKKKTSVSENAREGADKPEDVTNEVQTTLKRL
jgi:hypothetical protein